LFYENDSRKSRCQSPAKQRRALDDLNGGSDTSELMHVALTVRAQKLHRQDMIEIDARNSRFSDHFPPLIDSNS
jgi:hypothetical protein